MTTTIPAPTIPTPTIRIVASRPADFHSTRDRGQARPGVGARVGGMLARVVSAVSIVVLALFAIAFTAVWVVVTLLVHAVGLGRSGRLRTAASRHTAHARRTTRTDTAPSSTGPASAA